MQPSMTEVEDASMITDVHEAIDIVIVPLGAVPDVTAYVISVELCDSLTDATMKVPIRFEAESSTEDVTVIPWPTATPRPVPAKVAVATLELVAASVTVTETPLPRHTKLGWLSLSAAEIVSHEHALPALLILSV